MAADTPERRARDAIDANLEDAGWRVHRRQALDLSAAHGVAATELPMGSGHGFADYALFVNRRLLGVVEAKAGGALTGAEAQTVRYATGAGQHRGVAEGRPDYLFQSNGAVTGLIAPGDGAGPCDQCLGSIVRQR